MSVNKVILLGHLGKDPESKVLESGRRVTTFSLATTERAYKTASGTEIPERTEWHNVVLWRGLAEVAEKYVRKGSQVYIEGRIKNRSYTDNTGAKRYVTEVFVDQLELIDSRKPADPATNSDPMPESNNSNSQNEDDLPF